MPVQAPTAGQSLPSAFLAHAQQLFRAAGECYDRQPARQTARRYAAAQGRRNKAARSAAQRRLPRGRVGAVGDRPRKDGASPATSSGTGRPAGAAAEHPVHHGRRHRLDAAEHLPPRPDGRRNAQHRPHRTRRRDVHGLLCRAELHGGALCLFHRNEPPASRHDHAAAPRQPVISEARHPDARQGFARSRLHHWRVRQEPPR